jgi:signal transduction histidine kinase
MINNLRRRFIIFNILVISTIIIIVGLVMFVGSPRHTPRDISPHRYIITLLLGIVLVVVGSWLLSKKAVAPIEKAWQKQLDFTADASHELRTPIAVIQTNLELVLDSPDETVASQMKWLKNIEAENNRMAQLVGDLLTLSRADTNEQVLVIEPLMLNEIIAETMVAFEPVATEKQIELQNRLADDIIFNGDRKRMQQLIAILLDNALTYMGRAGEITINLQADIKYYMISVFDTGQGIEPEHLDKIFDRFYRVSKTRTLNQAGAGLGLAIAKWIVTEHGGSIHVDSIPDIGTTFTISLPK